MTPALDSVFKKFTLLTHEALMSDVIEVDDNNFEVEVINSNEVVLVKLGADWCGPCNRQQDILNRMFSNGKNTNIKLVYIDVDDAPLTVAKLGIRSVPSLLFYKHGKLLFQKIGLTSEADLSSKILECALILD